MKPYPTLLAILAGLALAAVTGCGEKDAPEESQDDAQSTAAVDPRIDAVFLDQKPEGAVSVLQARKSVEPGTALTVTGRIAGVLHPFSADYATLVLADDSIQTCERIPGDECPTPWDACCVEPETLAAGRLTIQVVDEEGLPLGASLKSVRGLKELDTLVITGKVAEGSNDTNLIINASGIYAATN